MFVVCENKNAPSERISPHCDTHLSFEYLNDDQSWAAAGGSPRMVYPRAAGTYLEVEIFPLQIQILYLALI